MIHLDTSFIVDLLREAGRSRSGPAMNFLERLAEDEVRVSVHVACELYAGAELASNPSRERGRVEEICGVIDLAFPDERFAPTYGRLLSDVRQAGRAIATMDLLIATAALVDEAALVTRNIRHFKPVRGLDVIAY